MVWFLVLAPYFVLWWIIRGTYHAIDWILRPLGTDTRHVLAGALTATVFVTLIVALGVS